MKLRRNNGFTLTEVLVAILIIAVASAALAASVSSASNINSVNIKSDAQYINDLKDANIQDPDEQSGASLTISGGGTTFTQDVTVYGQGDLSTANSEITHPENDAFSGYDSDDSGGSSEGGSDEDEEQSQGDTPDDSGTGGETGGGGGTGGGEGSGGETQPNRSVPPTGNKANLHDSGDLFRDVIISFGSQNDKVLRRNLHRGDLIVIGNRFFVVTNDITRAKLDSKLWFTLGESLISKGDIKKYYDNYRDSRNYLTEITSSKLNSTVVKDEITVSYSKDTLIFYKGQYYLAAEKTEKTDIPGESSKWIPITQ